MNKIFYRISMAVITMAIILTAAFFYVAFHSVKVIQPNVQPYKVLTKNVTAGDTLKYVVDACKFEEAPTTIVRRFIDTNSVAYSLPPQESNVPKGCKKSIVPLIVPDTLPKGTWYLTLDVAYQVNPLRTESYHFTTETFEVH